MTPDFSGFKPCGVNCHKSRVIISYEEYEALKMCDYELFTQAEAANLMNISRPTFTRIYESVRRKIARAFVEGAGIYFEGEGNFNVDEWYKCENCKIVFTIPDQSGKICPFCKGNEIKEK